MSDWKGQRWEYHVTQHLGGSLGAHMQDEELDGFGQWGWELVTVTTLDDQFGKRLVYTFKRPIQQPKIEMP